MTIKYQTKQNLNKKLLQDKEGHSILIKRPIYQEDIIIINTQQSPKYKKQTELKGQIDISTIMVGNFNIPL